jgi:hypothetical protein
LRTAQSCISSSVAPAPWMANTWWSWVNASQARCCSRWRPDAVAYCATSCGTNTGTILRPANPPLRLTYSMTAS